MKKDDVIEKLAKWVNSYPDDTEFVVRWKDDEVDIWV